MADNEFSTGNSAPTTVISIVYYSLLSRARIMRGLLLKRYAVCYSKGTLKTFHFPQGGCGKLIGIEQLKGLRPSIYLTVYTF